MISAGKLSCKAIAPSSCNDNRAEQSTLYLFQPHQADPVFDPHLAISGWSNTLLNTGCLCRGTASAEAV